MRAFIALELPEAFADEVDALVRRLEAACAGRFVPAAYPPRNPAGLGAGGGGVAPLAPSARAPPGAGVGPVPLAAAGLGTFGRGRDATLWLGIEKNDELQGLAARVRAELAARGLTYDEKDFLPHVTLARRARMPRGDLGDLAFPLPDVACDVTLFRSILGPSGARYKPLYTVGL